MVSLEESKDGGPAKSNDIPQLAPKLWTYQANLRFRHVSRIVARQISLSYGSDNTQFQPPKCPLPSCILVPAPSAGFFYTIEAPSSKTKLYFSEIVCSVNPNWKSFDVSLLHPIHLQSLKGFTVKIWYKSCHGNLVNIFSWGVNLSGLLPVSKSVLYEASTFIENTLLFKINNTYYTLFHCLKACPNISFETFMPPLYKRFSTLLSETKRSYSVNSLLRFHETKRDQRKLDDNCDSLREELEERGIRRDREDFSILTEVECIKVKVAQLRKDLEIKIDRLRNIKKLADELDGLNQDNAMDLMNGYYTLKRKLTAMENMQENINSETFNLQDLNLFLLERRRQILLQLPNIFPLKQDTNGHYYICGIYLPDAEDYEGIDDTCLSVAIGYVAHLLIMLSHFLCIPLRYPILHYGSQSIIMDTTSAQLQDKEREFPLHTRGKEREKLHFHYGVFLLNKNIAQLRWYYGLPTSDLRSTLANLASLLTFLSLPGEKANHSAVMPDMLVTPPSCGSSVDLTVNAPTSLLLTRREPRLPLNPAALIPNTSEFGLYTSDTDSLKSSPGKQLPDDANEDIYIKNRKLNIINYSVSLDHGLDEITEEKSLLTRHHSDHYLHLYSAVSFSQTSPCDEDANKIEIENESFAEQQTADLLKSWHEDASSHYESIMKVDSAELLGEVGIECREDNSFIFKLASNSDKKEITVDTVSNCNETHTEKGGDPKVVLHHCASSDSELFLSDFDFCEDFSFNDVAARTAILASQNRSFKMFFAKK